MRLLSAKPRYALVTAAHNEEAFIERTLLSVTSQILLPERWLIVDDGSTDKTAQIVHQYAREHSVIQLLELSKDHPPDFASQVRAINAGFEELKRANIPFDFIGNLDADISLEPFYFSRLIGKFETDPRLGLAGGWLHEPNKGEFRPRRGNRSRSVPHAVQFFRKSCFQEIGGYTELRYGAPDWCAEVSARMNGWRVQSFPTLRVFHNRPTGTVGGCLRYSYRAGLAASSLGSLPLFEAAKCIGRLRDRPYVLSAVTRLVGFAAGRWRREGRQVSPEFVRFLRGEQERRLWAFLASLKLSPRKTQSDVTG